MAKKLLVVIDGKSVFYRGYYAMPDLSTKDGTPTGGVYGFTVMALEILKKFHPDYVAVAWDKPKTNIRRRLEIYPEYKANRIEPPKDFYVQVPILQDLLKCFSWPFYEIDDHEADDIMGTLALQARDKGMETILISSDRDLLQLIGEDIKVAMLKQGLTNVEVFDDEHFESVYKMTTKQFVDYKSMRGDPSDNIPGVKGIGEKTALQLITEYGSLDNVYEHLKDIKPAIAIKLESGKELAYITKKLVLLDSHVPVEMDWDNGAIGNLNATKLRDKLVELEFRSLMRALPKELAVEPQEGLFDATTIGSVDTLAVVSKPGDLPSLSEQKTYYIHVFCQGKHGRGLSQILLSDGNKNWQILVEQVGKEQVRKWLKALKRIQIIAHDSKQVIKALLWLGIKTDFKVVHDTKVGAFLINALIRTQSLTELAGSELAYDGPSLDEVAPEDFAVLGGTILAVIQSLHKIQLEQLAKLKKVAEVAENIEWPVIPVLAEMEVAGIQLDKKYLSKMSKKFEDRISDVTQSIYGLAGQEFNISSPAQLGTVLYEKLALPTYGVKKGKTGFSTAANELEKLVLLHPIIKFISEYRELTKLKSTYVDALPLLVDDDGRLRTVFSLTVAQTGRLSSSDPNLQNIPVRSEMGRDIRRAFVAGPGNVFISVDYSQFELRLAAEMAGDDELIEAFNDGLDIHTRTAAQVYGCALEDVTKTQRDHAKTINFGILYGMSPHGLSQATGMSPQDAKSFIDRYFELRKPILDFIEATRAKAKKDGYVETLLGRRRPTPDVHSANFVVREAAYRAAVNMPIQGTEADIMKMAMIEVQKSLDDDCWQLLQIHDSILIECPKAKADKTATIVKDIMQKIYKLKVNLDVEVTVGNNWGEL